MSRNVRSTRWFWFFIVLGAIIASQVLPAIATYDSACGGSDAARHWVVLPPHWECDRAF